MKNFLITIPLIFLLSVWFLSAGAQDSIHAIPRDEAARRFEAKDYSSALPMYRELLNRFPGEPEYQFCTGVCLVNLNGDLDEAIRLLRPVHVADYSPLSIYYLGRALHLNYYFEDAIKAYSRFMLKGKKSDIRNFNIERLIEMARNGMDYTRSGKMIQVQHMRTIQVDALQNVSEGMGMGKMMKKPIEFCSKSDIRTGYRPWMYLPAYTEINEYVFTAGYENGNTRNKQLFRIKNINHETWGIPEPLNDMINTKYSEEFPFFDTKSSTLYFSSDGHSSMGGYDIFKSVYDWNTKSWSRPQNMGFPINSPFDDIIYIADELNYSATLVSLRNCRPNEANLYKIRIQADTTGVHFITVDEIRKAAQLIAPEPAKETTENLIKDSIETVIPSKPLSNYNMVLSEALLLQLKADSSARITRDLRIQARETPDDSTKKQLISDILRNDKESKKLQRQADEKFAEARLIKGEHMTTQEKVDSAVIFKRQINDIKLYRYRSDADEIEPETKEPVENNVSLLTEEPGTDIFSVATASPYSETNPIPLVSLADTGLVYRIQLGVFSKAKPNDAFGGIHPITYEQVPGTSILKYYAGYFYSVNSAVKALETVRSTGYTDAFIVAFYNRRLISTEKAREIEFAGFKL